MNKSGSVISTLARWQNQWRILWLNRQVAAHAEVPPEASQAPVVFFNASTRITGLSQNAAFALLTSQGLRLAGIPVQHFVCRSGMSHCVLGTNRQDHHRPPPCQDCLRQSQRLYAGADVHWFDFHPNPALEKALYDLDIDQLSQFEFPLQLPGQPAPGSSHLPLGRLVLPSIRWALRRHTLPEDEQTRYLMRQYMLSAYHVAEQFAAFLHQASPRTVVIFNGAMYPEAAARWASLQMGFRTVTHEVGFQPFSAFFTEGEATAYPIHIPEEFELSAEQNARLDAYLEKRFQGKFSMAGIRFWPEMRGLDADMLRKIAQFKQLVPVFTNVAYDTSQVHANQVFPSMFAWLDLVLELIRSHPETLFVIRAHPDEMRPGTAKLSRESVHDWVHHHAVHTLPNVIFIDSQEYLSSYELIQRAKFVIVYNSSIGMEATLMGVPVLCGGKARYTQYPIVFFPTSPQSYQEMAETFLEAKKIELPPEFQRNARRFLYYQLYRASLSFAEYLQEGPRKGFVHLRPFSWRELLPNHSPTLQILANDLSSAAQPANPALFTIPGDLPLLSPDGVSV
ncbi:MAG: hypothetical protein JXB15_10885 [Anaerolineales bacterium]|nr:hypothetical protein [Anaerolineales bacterium]